MSAIILEILKKKPDTIFTQSDLIDEIEKETGKTKSKSAVSQVVKTLYIKNLINYEKGIGKRPAQISYLESYETKPKPISSKPKPIPPKISPKPKPISPKPKPIEISIHESEYPTLLKETQEIEELEESLTTAKETVIFQQDEIDNLKKQLDSFKGFLSGKQPFTFLTFSEYMLTKARKTGSNSYKWGELVFRKTDLKNIYLIILELKERKLL